MPGGGAQPRQAVRRLAGLGQGARRQGPGVRDRRARTASSAARSPRTSPTPSATGLAEAVGAKPGDAVFFARRRTPADARRSCSARPAARSPSGCGLIDESAWSFCGSSTRRCSRTTTSERLGWTAVHHPFTSPNARVDRPVRGRPGRGAGLRLRHRLQRQRDRRRLDPYPPAPTCSSGSSTLLGITPRGGPGEVRVPARGVQVRPAAARRHRVRLGPHLHAARRRRLDPRGDRVPEDRRRLRPADRGADADHPEQRLEAGIDAKPPAGPAEPPTAPDVAAPS